MLVCTFPRVFVPTAIAKMNNEFKMAKITFCQAGIAAIPIVRIPSRTLIASAVIALGRVKLVQSELVIAIVIAPAIPGVSIDFGLRKSPKTFAASRFLGKFFMGYVLALVEKRVNPTRSAASGADASDSSCKQH